VVGIKYYERRGENNTRCCMKKKERKTEQWEDKSSYIHRSSSPDIALTTSLSYILHNRKFLC
jgi:hypothetical protein